MSKLKLIGYWKEDHNDTDWPHPRKLICKGWREKDKAQIIKYLKSGATLNAYMGYSFCRFESKQMDEKMGYREFTDGVWAWPEGLAHYIEHHSVMLPDEFIQHMELNNYEVPQGINLAEFKNVAYERTFWKDWCQKTIKERRWRSVKKVVERFKSLISAMKI